MIAEYIGIIASIIATASFFPQAIRVWKTQSCHDFSWGWCTLFCVSNSLWLIYGILLDLRPIIAANALILGCMTYILYVKIRTSLRERHENN
jgi:MtN3 and saliva related transmembrane protein